MKLKHRYGLWISYENGKIVNIMTDKEANDWSKKDLSKIGYV